MQTINYPLISILLITYNQERYVEDALNSLICQSYNNFEIIVSDDCSSDRTVEIVKKIIKNNKRKINIELNSNKNNLGIAKNVAIGLSYCKGEYIALAAGDDISLSNRIEKQFSFLKNNRKCFGVFSNSIKIDKEGNDVSINFETPPVFAKTKNEFIWGFKKVWSHGATLFFHNSVYSFFGDFLPGTYAEDGCIPFRCILQGGFLYIDTPLVKYRISDNNVSQGLNIERKVFFKNADVAYAKNMMADYLKFDSYVFFAKSRLYLNIFVKKSIFLIVRQPRLAILLFRASKLRRDLF